MTESRHDVLGTDLVGAEGGEEGEVSESADDDDQTVDRGQSLLYTKRQSESIKYFYQKV